MSTTNELNDTQRAEIFATWLKPMQPSRPTRQSNLQKLAPWRKLFVDARDAGFSWSQLAKNVASKPEIGVTISGRALMQCIVEALRAAGETVPDHLRQKRRHVRKGDNAMTSKSSPVSTVNAAAR